MQNKCFAVTKRERERERREGEREDKVSGTYLRTQQGLKIFFNESLKRKLECMKQLTIKIIQM